MAAKIHHNTAKKAKAHGITLSVLENEIVATKDGVTLATGLQGNVVLDAAIAKLDATRTVYAGFPHPAKPNKRPAKVKKPAKAKPARDDDEELEEDGLDLGEESDGEPEEGKSIVKGKYKTKYRPFKMTNGDDLAQRLKEHLNTKDGDDGKLRIDEAKMKRFAQANGAWDPAYAKLNVGQRRMNIGNRLRAKVRRDQHVIVWAV